MLLMFVYENNILVYDKYVFIWIWLYIENNCKILGVDVYKYKRYLEDN